MSSTTDKIKGVANEAAGKVKETAGNATGSDKLKAEGLSQQAKGEAQKTVARRRTPWRMSSRSKHPLFHLTRPAIRRPCFAF